MAAAGYSPSVRLFEAAACGVPIISDTWPGLELLFDLRTEILPVDGTEDVLRVLRDCCASRRQAIADAARAKVLRRHTAGARARELEAYIQQVAVKDERGTRRDAPTAASAGAACLGEPPSTHAWRDTGTTISTRVPSGPERRSMRPPICCTKASMSALPKPLGSLAVTP